MPVKQKLDFEIKVNLVQRYLSCKISVSEAAQESHAAAAAVRAWIVRYEAERMKASFLKKPCS